MSEAFAETFVPDRAVQLPALSIVVCTYNRCDKLDQALRAIERACRRHARDVELVIVDNNSSDDTKSVIDRFARSSVLAVRYVREARQGLVFARNRGLGEAKGGIIACTDDDCIVGDDWVDVILREFGGNPEIGLIGGRVDLHDPEARPVTIRPYGERVRYSGIGHVLTLIIGCNFAFRRELVEIIGLFDPAFGGGNGVVADDIEFIYRAVRQGVGVEYLPSMVVRHDHGRGFDHDLDGLLAGYVRGRGAFYAKYILRGDGAVLKAALWETATECRHIVRRLVMGKAIRGNLAFLGQLASGAWRLARFRISG